MITSVERFYALATGILGLLAFLTRVAFLLGKIRESFDKHMEESVTAHRDYEMRLRTIEHARRR